jgi:class 3 adenylate cyclase
MFADVSGFTATSHRMDPEDVTNVMNRCFAMLESVVTTHRGTVDKSIGDCV